MITSTAVTVFALSLVPHNGGEGDRTPDLVNAIHALSQLSYAPIIFSRPHVYEAAKQHGKLVRAGMSVKHSVACFSLPRLEGFLL
jgi:hypothetical protein